MKHGIISIEDQRFIAEVNQHRMVLIVEPATEDIEATVLWPGRGVGEPTSQLIEKNLFAKFAQCVRNVLFGIALRIR